MYVKLPSLHCVATHLSPCLMSQLSWSIEMVSSCMLDPRNTFEQAGNEGVKNNSSKQVYK